MLKKMLLSPLTQEISLFIRSIGSLSLLVVPLFLRGHFTVGEFGTDRSQPPKEGQLRRSDYD
jgi:hypothetical protein